MRRAGITAVAVAVAGTFAPATAQGRERVIVLTRESVTAGVARSVRAAGGGVNVRYHVLDGFAATVSAAERRRLAHDPSVVEVVPDSLVAPPRDTER
ncbi:MAG: Peptidase inhibitor, partial [Solirubrobacteraceae bacterium]|nr:Peptidase inhibitor [Solirubrobacteraceae bacterium]